MVLEIVTGIILLITLAVFTSYSVIMVKHAAQFRYLSSRTVYLTLFFAGISSVLIVVILASYLGLLLN